MDFLCTIEAKFETEIYGQHSRCLLLHDSGATEFVVVVGTALLRVFYEIRSISKTT